MQNVGIVVSFLNAYVLAVRSMSNMNIVLCSDYKCFFQETIGKMSQSILKEIHSVDICLLRTSM